MGNDLSFVGEASNGCMIYRESTGRYVVGFQDQPCEKRKVATLASAYATCQGLTQQRPNGGTGSAG